jgi:hypothetical protein
MPEARLHNYDRVCDLGSDTRPSACGLRVSIEHAGDAPFHLAPELVHTTADLADGGEGLAELVRDGVGCCEDVLGDSDPRKPTQPSHAMNSDWRPNKDRHHIFRLLISPPGEMVIFSH